MQWHAIASLKLPFRQAISGMAVVEAIQPTHGKFVSCMTTIGVFTPKGASLNRGRPETRQINGSRVKNRDKSRIFYSAALRRGLETWVI